MADVARDRPTAVGASGGAGEEGRPAGDEDGFTLVEMIVAMTMLAFSLMALAQMTFGAMSALQATRQRSTFVELVTAEMEQLRSLPYDRVCVKTGDLAATYEPGGTFEGRPAAVGNPCEPDPESTVAASDGATAHVVRRWVTFTDTAGGGGSPAERFKRLTVELDWDENGKFDRTIRLTSVLYPGGLGDGPVGNVGPVAVGAASPSVGALAGALVSFTAAGSSDADGDTLSYQWDFGDGSATVAGSTASHAYAAAGGYTAQLRVSDGKGGLDYVAIPIAISSADGNTPPSAVLTATSASSGVAPLVVTFDASGSTDPDAGDSIATYAIDWGDGTAPTTGAINASHEFAGAGTFTVVLTVSDTGGLTATDSVLVTTTPLDCAITDGFFRNPSNNATANDITVNGSGIPDKSSFTFRATTNSACTTLSVSLPLADGTTFDATLTEEASAGSVKSWSSTSATAQKFSLSANQVGVFKATGASGAIQRSVTYTVHKK